MINSTNFLHRGGSGAPAARGAGLNVFISRLLFFLDWLMALPAFLEAARQKMEARGIPFAVIPLAVVIVIALTGYFFFLRAPATTAFKITVLSAGEPAAGAVVEVYDDKGNFLDSAVSDENGLASFKALPAKRLKFKVAKTGLEAVERSLDLSKTVSARVELAAPTPTPVPTPAAVLLPTPVPTPAAVLLPTPTPEPAETTPANQYNFEDPPKAKLTVIVRNKASKAVDGTVKLFNSYSGAEVASAETKAGLAVFEDLELGTIVFITVDAPGYLPFPEDGKKKEVTVKAGANSVTVLLSPETSENSAPSLLRVVDEANNSVSGARAWILSLEDHVIVKQGETGGDGSWNVTLPSGFSYYAVAKKDGYLPGRAGFSSGALPTITVVKATENNSARLVVFVGDEDGNPVSGANVSVKTDVGEFLLPPKTTGSDGRAEFRELAIDETVLAVGSKGNKIGERSVALDNRTVQANITLVMHVGVIKMSARDALTNSLIKNPRFTAYWVERKIAECAGNNCSLVVRANAPIIIQATHSDYFAANVTEMVLSDNTTSGMVYLIPRASVRNSEAIVQAIFDIRNPLERAEGAAVKNFQLKRGHDYSIQINFASTGIASTEEGGLLVRASEGIVFKRVDRRVGFRGSNSLDCGTFDEQMKEDVGYAWIDLRTKGPTELTYSIDFRVDPSAPETAAIEYSTYVVKAGQWLRNPFDPVLGLNESSETRQWCGAEAKETLSFQTTNPDRTCSSIGCIEVTFTQGNRECGFTEFGESCEYFTASADTDSFGNLVAHYSITPYAPPATGNSIKLEFDSTYFDFVELTVPSHGDTIYDETTETTNTPVASVDKAIKRADFSYYGVIEGAAVLAPKRPTPGADTTDIKFSFTNSKGSIQHKVPVSIEPVGGARWFTTKFEPCKPTENDCDVYCVKPVGDCEDYEVKMSVSFEQLQDGKTVSGGRGMTVKQNKGTDDLLKIRYKIEDRTSPRAGGDLTLSGYGTDLVLFATTDAAGNPRLDLDSSKNFKRTISEDETGAGKTVEGIVFAEVKKMAGKIDLVFNYKGQTYSTFVTSFNLPVIPALPLLPSKYVIKYLPSGVDECGNALGCFQLYDQDGNKKVDNKNIDLWVTPIFPADAVYLEFDYSQAPATCLDTTPIVKDLSERTCYAIEDTEDKRQKLLKYDATKPSCATFSKKLNEVKNSSAFFVVSMTCIPQVQNKVNIAVAADNENYMALLEFRAWSENPEEYPDAFNQQRHLYVLANNRQYTATGSDIIYTTKENELKDRSGVKVLLKPSGEYRPFFVNDNSDAHKLFNQTGEEYLVGCVTKVILQDGTGVDANICDSMKFLGAAITVIATNEKVPEELKQVLTDVPKQNSKVVFENTLFRRRRPDSEVVEERTFPFSAFVTNVGQKKLKYFLYATEFGNSGDGKVGLTDKLGITIDAPCNKWGERGVYAVWTEYDVGNGKVKMLGEPVTANSGDYLNTECAADNTQLCGTLSFRDTACVQNCGDGWYFDYRKGHGAINACGVNIDIDDCDSGEGASWWTKYVSETWFGYGGLWDRHGSGYIPVLTELVDVIAYVDPVVLLDCLFTWGCEGQFCFEDTDFCVDGCDKDCSDKGFDSELKININARTATCNGITGGVIHGTEYNNIQVARLRPYSAYKFKTWGQPTEH